MVTDSKISSNDKYIIFESQGGHGKQICATAVIRAIKKAYPDRKLIWITPWDGPAFYNPDIFRFFCVQSNTRNISKMIISKKTRL
jgi:ADP-heptose:LPS heptosyltransferase